MAQWVVDPMIPFSKNRMMTATMMRRKVKMEQESGVKGGAKEVILRAAGGRMMPGTPLMMVDMGKALG
jgi:hypothetical protein